MAKLPKVSHSDLLLITLTSTLNHGSANGKSKRHIAYAGITDVLFDISSNMYTANIIEYCKSTKKAMISSGFDDYVEIKARIKNWGDEY